MNDPDLADAFDADDSDSDDEPDDRQRLVRQNSEPVQAAGSDSSSSQQTPSSGAYTPPEPTRSNVSAAAATSSNRVVFGSGIQNDGIFSNLTAKPERSGTEKEEQPPVRLFYCLFRGTGRTAQVALFTFHLAQEILT